MWAGGGAPPVRKNRRRGGVIVIFIGGRGEGAGRRGGGKGGGAATPKNVPKNFVLSSKFSDNLFLGIGKCNKHGIGGSPSNFRRRHVDHQSRRWRPQINGGGSAGA